MTIEVDQKTKDMIQAVRSNPMARKQAWTGERITITVRRETLENLKKFGKFGESWDDLLTRLAQSLK